METLILALNTDPCTEHYSCTFLGYVLTKLEVLQRTGVSLGLSLMFLGLHQSCPTDSLSDLITHALNLNLLGDKTRA